MTLFQALVLGLIQGVTEFLPISSSAHLILTSKFLGWQDQGLHFDMATHVGSLLAVVGYFRADWAELASGLRASLRGEHDPRGRMAVALLVATIPVGLGGLLFQKQIAVAGRHSVLIAWTSIVFAVALGVASFWGARRRSLEKLGWKSILAVGIAQALALAPGTSRSGITITAGLGLGLERESAARLSLLLSLPVGLLVAAKSTFDLVAGGSVPMAPGWALAVGFLSAAVSAYAAIGWMLAWLRRHGAWPFVIYRLLLGGAILLAL